MLENLTIKAAIQILKPVHEVFEAIVDPAKMSNYFITQGSGTMTSGKEIFWKFPEFNMQIPIQVEVVTVTEKSMPHDEAGLKWLQGNTEGWANFLACLKAFTEHGINLRKGAFNFRKDEFKEMK